MAVESAFTSELDAVNLCLRNIGQAKISTLEGTIPPDAVNARATIKRVSKEVQGASWNFNTECDFVLERAPDGRVVLPLNTLRVDAVLSKHPTLDPVQRGQYLYDRANRTYVFDTDLTCTLVLLLPWSELPETARNYIQLRAAREFQEDTLGATAQASFDARDEARALAEFLRAHGDTSNLNMLGNYGSFRPGSTLRR